MEACTSNINVCICYLTILKTATFKVQEQITSHPSVFREVIKDSFVFVNVNYDFSKLIDSCNSFPL